MSRPRPLLVWNLILVTILTKIQVRKKIKFHEKMYFILYILLFFQAKLVAVWKPNTSAKITV